MPDRTEVARHYSNGNLLRTIELGVQKLGKTRASATTEDLGPVDEFHIGGRIATESFLDQLNLSPNLQVLDVGCGIGGTARFAAHTYGCHVIGVDLTPDYVDTGNELSAWVGLRNTVELEVGDATALRHADDSFDRAFVMHVGMNIARKRDLMAELFRVLKPGGILGVYDIMRMQDGELTFPVPWATTSKSSALGTPIEYREALEAAGFAVTSERNRGDFSLEFFTQMQEKAVSAGGPPPLGIHLLMGDNASQKVANMVQNVRGGLIAPYEIVARRP